MKNLKKIGIIGIGSGVVLAVTVYFYKKWSKKFHIKDDDFINCNE